MPALVCQYAHLKVDTLAHWQPVEITQCRSDGVVLAGTDDQASCCILYGLQTLHLVACDTDKRAVAVVQSAVYERLDECLTCDVRLPAATFGLPATVIAERSTTC